MQTPIFVNQEGAHEKTVSRLDLSPAFKLGRYRTKALDEALIAKPKIVQIPSQLNQLLRRVVRRQHRIKRHHFGQQSSRSSLRAQGPRIKFRMRKNRGGNLAEPAPDQFLADGAPLGRAHRRHDDQGPSARPLRVRFAVNALRRLGEAFATVLRQPILAELALTAAREPAVLNEPGSRRAHQPLIQPKRRRQVDQAAQSNGAAPRHDGVPKQGHDERSAAQRALPAKASNQFDSAGGGVFGHVRRSKSADCYDTKNIAFPYFLYHYNAIGHQRRHEVCTRKAWMRKPRTRRRRSTKAHSNSASWPVWTPRKRSSPRTGCPPATAIP